jgi:hypothetical protein
LNIVATAAVTSWLLYVAALAMATGETGAGFALPCSWGAALSNGVAATMASHSLLFMLNPLFPKVNNAVPYL